VRPPDPALLRDLSAIFPPARVLARPLDRLVRSVDASIYRLVPEVVVRPVDVAEVRDLLACARGHGRPVTFRAAGTSLAGQAVTEGILVELAHGWRGLGVLGAGLRVRAEPGVIGGHVNRRLAPLGRRLGPDPASLEAAMMGGIVANNGSGMCGGVAHNSYHTLEAMTVVLADGTRVDSGAPGADAALARGRPDLNAGLAALRDEVRARAPLADLVRRRFALKNTTAYSLNAFLDFDRPVDILTHLMVGAQGTLGFMADVTLRTVPDPPARATALACFPGMEEAAAVVPGLVEAGAAALEIMDAVSLRSQAEERPPAVALGTATAALLVEMQEADDGLLDAAVERARRVLAGASLLAPTGFSRDPEERRRHWRLRKGLFARVGALRPPGTAVMIEDVAVPTPRLAEAVADLRALCDRRGFKDAVIFGHARDGNLHFVFAQDFSREQTVRRYGQLLEELVELVAGKYDGSIKAEHGSGRNMAPFVRREWGEEGWAVMRRVKALFDPSGLLNPGVILNDDPGCHLRDLKPLPRISPLADRCIECGFCEPRCPSRDLTLSPRQRIVAVRERVRLAAAATSPAFIGDLEREFAHQGLDTCATDGMCQAACPVEIDTGALVKELRCASSSARARRWAERAANRFGLVAALARAVLRAAGIVGRLPAGRSLVAAVLARLGAGGSGRPRVELPRPAPPLPALPPPREGRAVVYFPSCLTRVLGALPGENDPPMAEALVDVLGRVGISSRYPEGLAGLCCGMPFGSKGFPAAAARLAARTLEALARASEGGRLAVVTDASPCAATLRERAGVAFSVEVLDFPSFWARHVLPGRSRMPRRPGTAVLHPTCTLQRGGGLDDLLAVGRAHAERVVVPDSAECCGFAGDRGFLFPELTASATAAEGAELAGWLAEQGAGFYSTCRTCEIGLGRAAGRPCRSLVHLVREALACG
jgi:D-lactate dehydrogenase